MLLIRTHKPWLEDMFQCFISRVREYSVDKYGYMEHDAMVQWK